MHDCYHILQNDASTSEEVLCYSEWWSCDIVLLMPQKLHNYILT